MTALTDFLLARVAEDEAAAKEQDPVGWVTFRQPDGSMDHTAVATRTEEGWIVDGRLVHDAAASAFYDPARALVECEAKRRIVGYYAAALEEGDGADVCHAYLDAVEALALPYADHPDYREEWRP